MRKSIILLLFCTLFMGCDANPASEPETQPVLPQIEVSRIAQVNGKAQLIVGEQPFTLLGAQIRTDALINCDLKQTSDIEAYFAKAKELNLNCVQIPVWWNKIEPQENKFDFAFVNQMLEYTIKYNLKMELLWFSTNMCGDSFSYLIPQYVLSKGKKLWRSNSGAFWNYYGYQYSLVLDDPWILEKEKNAVTQLFNHIRRWDDANGNTHPVITAQIHNEPDCFMRWRVDQFEIGHTRDNKITKADAWKMTLNALNEVGKAVKNSSYKVATRTNLVMNSGVDPYHELPSASPRDVYALEGIDFVSVDPYKERISEIKKEVLGYQSMTGNYSLIAENKGVYSNTSTLILVTVALGGGYDIYDLATSKFFIDNTNDPAQIDHGVYTWDLKAKNHTQSVASLMKGLTAAGTQLGYTATTDFAAFNIKSDKPSSSISQEISTTGAKIGFNTTVSSIGFALDCKNYILASATDNATFTFGNGTTGTITSGYIDNKGEWHSESQTTLNQGKLAVQGGVLYRIEFTSAGALTSNTINFIGY